MIFTMTLLYLVAMLIFVSQVYRYFAEQEELKQRKRLFSIEDLRFNCLEILRRVDKMTGEQFEQFFIFILNTIGYNAYATRTTGDYGADSIIYIDGLRLVVQAKRYSKKVGVAAVREVLGAIKVYNANKGIVITNNFFSRQAYRLADCNDIDLWDRSKLIELIEQAQSKSGFN